MSPDLSIRVRQPELMDDPSIDFGVHLQALRGLRRINRWSRVDAVVWSAMLPAMTAAVSARRPLTILDVACGGGDLLIRLARRFQHHGIDVQLDGCDISRTAVSFAAQSAARLGFRQIQIHECDVLAGDLPRDHTDVVMCSLFLHHLERSQAVELLQKMKQAATGLVLVDDLCRSRIGYWLAWAGCRVLSRSRVVHADGPMSVAGAFTCEEAIEIAREAGLDTAVTRRHWPQRFLLQWKAHNGGAHA